MGGIVEMVVGGMAGRGITAGRWTALALALLSTPLAGQFADSVTARPVGEGLYVLEGAMDLIVASVGEDGTLLVDAGYAETESMVRDALERIGAPPVRMLVNTHWHHTFANAAFGTEAAVVAHQTVLERSRRANRMFGQLVPPVPPEGRPDVAFRDSLRIRFNDREIQLVHLPSAHTDGDIAVFFPEANVVATGDVAVAHMPWTDPDQLGRFDAMLESVDRLLEIVPEDATIVPGHGEPFGYQTLERYASMLHETADTVRARISRGWSLERVQEAGAPARWADWEGGVPAAVFLASVYRAYGPEDGAAPPPVIHFTGGRWWEDGAFRGGDWYSVGGRFTRARPARVDSIVDLGGGWVLPPLGDAHTHRFGETARLASDEQAFLAHGILYGMVQDPAHEVTEEMHRRADDPETVDLAYTQGVVTPSWGVMADFYTMMVEAGVYGEGVERSELEDRVVFFIDDAEDLDEKWPVLADLNDDFVKVIVAFSGEHERRLADPERYGAQPPAYSRKPGLDPALLEELVQRARAAGLRVSAHIETAADFRLALEAGVDLIAHLPGSWQVGAATGFPEGDLTPWLLTPHDAALAAARGTFVATTASPPPDKLDEPLFDEIHRHNLELLHRHGVNVVIGSDQFQGTVVDEILYLESLGVHETPELLRMTVEDTPRAIFPGRRIGRIAEGYEASFVVVANDPTEELGAVSDPSLIVKEGRVRTIPDGEGEN